MGIALQKNFIRYSILEGTRQSPILINKGRVTTASPDEVPELMDWYETQFIHLLNEYKPQKIGYKIMLDPKLEQLHTLIFPLGIINLLAKKQGIFIYEYSSRGITPNKLQLSKDIDLYKLVDEKIGNHPPYWDSTQKDSVLVGWFCL